MVILQPRDSRPPRSVSTRSEDPRPHGVATDRIQQVHGGGQSREVGGRQRPRLVAAGSRVRRRPVLEEFTLRLEVPPSLRARRDAFAGALGHEEDRAAFGAVEPLVRVGAENVHVLRRDVHRQGAEALDRVHDEQDSALPAKPADLGEREDEAVVEGHPRNGHDARAPVHERGDVLGRDAAAAALRDAALDAALCERSPGVGVGRELDVVGDDVVAVLPREADRHEVDAPARVGKKRDLGRGRADEGADLRARRLDHPVPRAPVRGPAVAHVLDVGRDRVGHAPGQRRHGGVVQVDEVSPHRELPVERGGGEVEVHPLKIFL